MPRVHVAEGPVRRHANQSFTRRRLRPSIRGAYEGSLDPIYVVVTGGARLGSAAGGRNTRSNAA